MIHFEIPKNQSSIIKVIGVGGGGGNAVNYMYNLGIDGVDFIVCNTDSQALAQSSIPNKIQLGPHLTQGLGAGANPEIGKQAGEESIDDIAKILKVNTKMAFITAGMGGGTGTGGAPIIAKVCRELGILTVGIVTTPFTYEGRKRLTQAQEGIRAMREYVDTILIISNDKLRQQFGNLPFTQAFAKADNVLSTAAKCITDLITVDGKVNLDFNDVQTVMKNGGVAILGSAQAEGEDRARTAVVEALSSPLLNDSEIKGAKWILLNVTSPPGDYEHTLDELEVIQAYVQQQAGNTCDIILGMGQDPNLDEKLSVTIIATGFQHTEINTELPPVAGQEEKIVVTLDQDQPDETADARPAPQPEEPKDELAPRLVEQPPAPKQETPQPRAAFNLELPKPPAAEKKPATTAQNTPQNDDQIKLVVKNESALRENQAAPQQASNPAPQRETRPVTEFEAEEKRIFEEQKKAFEERAERLRKMSIDLNRDNASDIENIPAYMRQSKSLQQQEEADADYLSGYSVDAEKNARTKSPISTINSFLFGKKPD